MPLSSYARDKLMDHLLRGAPLPPPAAIWISLHTADPGLTGAHEPTGLGYIRKPGTFGDALNGAKTLSELVAFSDLPAGTYTHFGVWDAAAGGNCLWVGQFAVNQRTAAGDTIQFSSGDLELALT
jgi:hypothetical protein